METIQVFVEFSAISRVLTGKSEFSLTLNNGASISDIVSDIGKKFPVLLGQIIEKDGKALIPTNVFSVNGQKIIHETDTDYQPNNGDKLILLSLLSGG
jgi:molybdopterin converting factor small subunit